MKFTKLSLVAALAVSAAFAGGDIEAVPAPVVEESSTTINGKLTGYYITDDFADDMFGSDHSQLGLAATLDVTHKFTDSIAMNFGAVGFLNTNKMDDLNPTYMYFEDEQNGAFMNVANLTATFMDTTFILGRQLLNTPMLSGFDWLLAPGAFEAYTVANSSIENVTFVGSYVRTFRANNTGDNFATLDGDNWTVSAAYDDKTISGSVWYYNVDAGDYSQVYADAGYNFGVAKVMGQYVYTDIDNQDASNVFGVKATAALGTFNLMAAYVNVSDNEARWVGAMDGLYTSSWNSTTGASLGNNFKVEAGTEFAGISASASYAYYEFAEINGVDNDDEGSEIDVILGYNITDTIDLNVIYTNTDYGLGEDTNALEIYANYKF